MKVFIAWSGEVSHQVAAVLSDWLPRVIQSAKPFISSGDVEKGSRWAQTIGEELETTSFGILCLTEMNLTSPWIHFEAGALSKALKEARVCTFLFGVQVSDVQEPLSQFQWTLFDKKDVKKLVNTLNNQEIEELRLSEPVLQEAFETRWPELDKRLNDIEVPDDSGPSDDGETRDVAAERAILEEILKLARSQQRMLSSQEEAKLGRLLKENIRMAKRQFSALNRLAGPAYPHRRTGQPLGESPDRVQQLEATLGIGAPATGRFGRPPRATPPAAQLGQEASLVERIKKQRETNESQEE